MAVLKYVRARPRCPRCAGMLGWPDREADLTCLCCGYVDAHTPADIAQTVAEKAESGQKGRSPMHGKTRLG